MIMNYIMEYIFHVLIAVHTFFKGQLHISKTKGVSEDVGSVIKHLFTDETLLQFNWDGRWERKPLNKLILVDTILRDAFNKKGAVELEKDIKKAVELSHHRLHQKNFLTKKSKNTSSGNL
ncbi:PREDICTED: uncharacterized protein LOC108375147 [Rhagoletis zephyria]|uniref:uncharacterized protein LOC108375147 n=1 Tax=Rhagoletis zephyria TaxID=28612 RepID=UPI0008116D57|nr:PREDICTED: uncharacterized protein LOC108375147 [Rhagoletis zephyria]